MTVIETPRLILRAYRDEDRPAIAEMNGHPDVGGWLGGVRTRAESDGFIDRANASIAERGYGFFCAERKTDGRPVGSIGILVMDDQMPSPGAVELGWRLHPHAHGAGLATEGAAACRDWAFANLDVDEVVAITARTNVRSQAVMRKIGMTPDPTRDFEHPRLAVGDPLQAHVFWTIRRPLAG